MHEGHSHSDRAMKRVLYPLIASGVILFFLFWRTQPSKESRGRVSDDQSTLVASETGSRRPPLVAVDPPTDGGSSAPPTQVVDVRVLTNEDLLRMLADARHSTEAGGVRLDGTELGKALTQSADAARMAVDLIASDVLDEATFAILRNSFPSNATSSAWRAALARIMDLGPRLGNTTARRRLADLVIRLVLNADVPRDLADLLVMWTRDERSSDVQARLLAAALSSARASPSMQSLVCTISMGGIPSPARDVADAGLRIVLEEDGPLLGEALHYVLDVSADDRESANRRASMLTNLLVGHGPDAALRREAEPFRQQLIATWTGVLVDHAQNASLRRSAFSFLTALDKARALALGSEAVKNDPDPGFRRYVFEQLGRFPASPHLVDVLVDGLLHPSFDTQRSSAILSLQERGDETALPTLESLVNDPKLGASARVAIQRIKGRAQASK